MKKPWHTHFVLFVAIVLLGGVSSCREKGCTDPLANNFNADAIEYDGSCEYDPLVNNITLTFHAKMGTENLAVNTISTDQAGNKVRVETFKFYVSDVRAVMNDDTEFPVKDIAIIDFHPDKNLITIDSRLPEGNYKALKFYLGLPASANLEDPNSFQSSHPLSVAQNMHWDWSLKYLFVKFDGLSDTTGTGNQYDHSFVYHCGSDDYYEEVAPLTTSFTIDNPNNTNVDVYVDVDKFFLGAATPINLKTDFSTHTADNEPLARKFTANVARAFSE